MDVPTILCDEVMTKELIVCLPDDAVTRAAELMREGHVGSLPVVDDEEQRNLLGVITEPDVVIRVIAQARRRAHDSGGCDDCDVVTAAPADDLTEAASRMMERRVRRLFITEHGRLLGVIAQADVASRGGERNVTAQLVERVSQP